MILDSRQDDQEIGPLDWPTRMIEGILAATLLFAPLAFGTVDPWSEQVVLVLVGSMALLFSIRLIIIPNTQIEWHGSYILIFLFIFTANLQLIALPSDLVRLLSPSTVAVKTDLLSSLTVPNLDLSTMPLSFYPNATAHDLRLVLAIATVFLIVFNLFTHLASIKRLLLYISVVGGGIALLAIAQFITQTDKIFWVVPIPPHTLADGGPFVNHSNFAQFMNLSIGAAVGLIFMRIHELTVDDQIDFSILEFIRAPVAKSLLLPGLTVIVGSVAVFVSLSRGGIISLLLAGGFITVLIALSTRKKGRGQIIAFMVLTALACVLYIGFDAVYERMATLHDFDAAQSGRLEILKDLTAAWSRFPIFGTGLGTHSVVYPMFNTSTVAALAGHAENEYAQVLEETGIVGLLIQLLFISCIGRAFVRSIQSKRTSVNAAAYGLGFGLLAVLVHSCSDFGQHLPANAFLSSIFCALLLRMGKSTTKSNLRHSITSSSVLPFRRIGAVICLVVTIGLSSVTVFYANKARVAQTYWTRMMDMEAYFDQIGWQGTNQQYLELLKNAEAASSNQPANVRYRHWLNVYRWRSISRHTDPNTGEVILSTKGIQTTQKIVDEFKKACVVCPTFGPTYCVLGQLQSLVLNDPNGLQHINTGYKLAPCDATACFIAGKIDAQQGECSSAFSKIERAVQLDGNYFQEAALVCLESLNEPNYVLALADNDIDRLSNAAMLLSQYAKKDNELSTEALASVNDAFARIKTLLEERSQQADAHPAIFASLANIYWRNRELDKAVDLYRNALNKDYGQTSWRYNLSQLLAEQSRLEEAIHEAKICLRLNSEFTPARQLIEELAVKASESEVAQQQ